MKRLSPQAGDANRDFQFDQQDELYVAACSKVTNALHSPEGNRGFNWSRKGNYDYAIADYTQAIQLNPELAESYYNRRLVYRQKGEWDKSIADSTEAIRINPDDAIAYSTASGQKTPPNHNSFPPGELRHTQKRLLRRLRPLTLVGPGNMVKFFRLLTSVP